MKFDCSFFVSALFIFLLIFIQNVFSLSEPGNIFKLESRVYRQVLPEENRDGRRFVHPKVPDNRKLSGNIANAHEVLRKALQQFLEFKDTDLETYLNEMINKTSEYVDEYGKVIPVYTKVFRFILEQHKEVQEENYAVGQFDKDKLDLCSVARYLSHQSSVGDRKTLMKRMGDTLEYRCHPCTPYKRRQHGVTNVPSTEGVNPEISPDESLTLCNSTLMSVTSNAASPEGAISTSATATDSPTLSTATMPLLETTPIEAETDSENDDTSNPETSFPSLNLNPNMNYGECYYEVPKRPITIFKEAYAYRKHLYHSSYRGDVTCDLVPIGEILEIFDRVARTTFDTITLNIRKTEKVIPADLLSNKRAENIVIDFERDNTGNGNSQQQLKKVSPDAFRATQNYTKHVELISIDHSQLDLGWLSGFVQLTTLSFTWNLNLDNSFPTLPPLPSLTILDFYQSYLKFKDIENFPTLINGLQFFEFYPTSKEDEGSLNRVLDWLLISSAETLEYLNIISVVNLTRIPPQISSFKALKYLNYNNDHTSPIIMKAGALTFSVPVTNLILSAHGVTIDELEPGAFQGNFKDAEIDLSLNLT